MSRRLAVVIGVVAVLLLTVLLLVGPGGGRDGWWGPMGGPMGGHMEGMPGRGGQGSAPEPVADAGEVTIEATEMAFDPASIEVAAGEPVNLVVTNVGEAFHDLTIDELDLRIEVDAGQTAAAGLEDLEPGEYDYYCSVPGHANAGMRGTLTVTGDEAREGPDRW